MSSYFFEIERFSDIGSTNTYLLERASQGAPAGLVAVTDHQSQGRGRLERRWEAPAGSSLLVSILLREAITEASAHFVTAAVALSASQAAEELCGVAPKLKWPNDLVIDGAKVAGILAEANSDAPGGGPGTTAIVVGMGMNLTWSGPPEAGATSLLAASGIEVDRDVLLDRFLAHLGERLSLLSSPEGQRTLSVELERSLDTLGKDVTVSTSQGSVTGRAVGLSPQGHLMIETSSGLVEIVTGDVTRVRPAPSEE